MAKVCSNFVFHESQQLICGWNMQASLPLSVKQEIMSMIRSFLEKQFE